MKNYIEIRVPIESMQDSIEGILEKSFQDSEIIPLEYKLGLYYEEDLITKGEIANIIRILKENLLSPFERSAIEKTLEGTCLNAAERKAKERGIKKLRILLQVNLIH